MSGEWYLSVPEFVTINGGGRMVAFLFCISRGSFSPAVRCQMRYGQLLHPSCIRSVMHQPIASGARPIRSFYVNVIGRLDP